MKAEKTNIPQEVYDLSIEALMERGRGIKNIFPSGKHIMPEEIIPEEFTSRHNQWRKIATEAFFKGTRSFDDWDYQPKEGVTPGPAFALINDTMGCRLLEHNHKMACSAFMLSLLFDSFRVNKVTAP
jgi:hypothetical protein